MPKRLKEVPVSGKGRQVPVAQPQTTTTQHTAKKGVGPVAQKAEVFETGPVSEAKPGTPENPRPLKRQFVYQAPPGVNIEAVTLKGSWSPNGAYAESWAGSELSMRESPKGSGTWVADVTLLDDGQAHPWKWGADIKLPSTQPTWGMFSLDGVSFDPRKEPVAKHTPLTFSFNGARRGKDGELTFRAWFPHAAKVSAKILAGPEGPEVKLPLAQDAEKGFWTAAVPGAFDQYKGRPYVYEVTASNGNTVDKVDCYAEELQGPQRGVRRLYIDPDSHRAVKQFLDSGEQRRPPDPMLWFDVPQTFAQGHREMFLVFKDEKGKVLTQKELLERVGDYPRDAIRTARGGEFDDFWNRSGGVAPDGRIRMTKVGEAFSAVVNNPNALAGLRYEFQTADGRPVGDADRDGRLNRKERSVGANDPWDNVLTTESGQDVRAGIITEALKPAPIQKSTPTSVIYQVHPSSFMSDYQNADPSTFQDLLKHLDYIQSLGVTDVQIQPPVQVPGITWGYEGIGWLATQNNLGFVMGEGSDKRWVPGREALQMVASELRKRGMNLIVDVVLNHVDSYSLSGQRWEHDGDKANSWLNHKPDHEAGEDPVFWETAWGKMPAINNPHVAQFLADYVLYLVTVVGASGVRFDFTDPIIQAGGSELLKKINLQLQAYGVGIRIAEQFPYKWEVTADVGVGGLGFSDTLFLEPHHKFINNPDGPQDRNKWSALAQAGARPVGSTDEINVDAVMNLIASDQGELAHSWQSAVMALSTHDEVGNGVRGIFAATGYQDAKRPDLFARALARLVHGVGATAPGKYMLFEGEESLAANSFRWGVPVTWSSGQKWQHTGKDWNWAGLSVPAGEVTTVQRLSWSDDRRLQASPELRRLSEEGRAYLAWARSLPDELRTKALARLNSPQETDPTGNGRAVQPLRFDADQRALYDELFALPEDKLRTDLRFLDLTPVNRQVFDHLRGLSPHQRAEAIHDIERQQSTRWVTDVLKFRGSIPELAQGFERAERIYTHNQDGVMAFKRRAQGGDVVVVANLSRENRQGYDVHLPPGNWKEVLNSDGREYGGHDFGNFGATVPGGSPLNLPAGGVVIFRQVQ